MDNIENKNSSNSNVTKTFVVAILAILLLTGMSGLLPLSQDNSSAPDTAFRTFATIVSVVVAVLLAITMLINRREKNQLEEKRLYNKYLVNRFNHDVSHLKTSYNSDIKQLKSYRRAVKSSLLRDYSSKYNTLRKNYLKERNSYLSSWKKDHRAWNVLRTTWAWFIIIGLFGGIYSCTSSMTVNDSVVTSEDSITYWNAENIPMPHLADRNRYVSNPDNILSDNTVNIVDQSLRRLDDSLGIESVAIIVNHIENKDPFRMAQDIGNKYGVGRKDMGLIIAIGYEDHLINMSTGRSLETFLTDAECYRLEQRYVIPAMRAQQPDSAMIYLSEGIYSLIRGKALPDMPELPMMTGQSSSYNEEDDIIGLYFLFFMLWMALAAFLEYRYEWLGIYSTMALISNPFVETTSSFSSGGGFGGGYSSGRGGYGGGLGGGFGGGSFGGGGATSGW